MRSGKLLAEESPHVLLSMYGCHSLEEVFLKLSRKQTNGANEVTNNISLATMDWGKKDGSVYVTESSGVVGLNFHQSKEVLIQDGTNGHLDMPTRRSSSAKSQARQVLDDCTNCSNFTTRGKFKALLQKNFLRMWRNVGVMLFIFALPVMQVILFCLAIGRDPTGLKLAVVNHERNFTNASYQDCPYAGGCKFTGLSCRYLDTLNNNSIIKEYFPTPTAAVEAVRNGDAWGALYFTENFTDALVARMGLGKDSDEETLDQSEIRVWLDMSSEFPQTAIIVRYI